MALSGAQTHIYNFFTISFCNHWDCFFYVNFTACNNLAIVNVNTTIMIYQLLYWPWKKKKTKIKRRQQKLICINDNFFETVQKVTLNTALSL